jgi:hypothetical protein
MAKTKKQIDEATGEKLVEDSVTNNVDTSPLEGMSKTNAMSVVMKQMADMQGDHWVDFFKAVQAQVGQFSAPTDGNADGNAASIQMRGDATKAKFTESVQADLDAIFGNSKELSEDFRGKIHTLFESAVNARVAIFESELQEAYEEALEEEVSMLHESLVEKLDDYVSYLADEFITENKVEIERTIQAEAAIDFVQALGELFLEHNYNIPEEQIDVLEMISAKYDELEEAHNEALLRLIEAEKMIDEKSKREIVTEMSANLTSIEAEKFKTLVEGFELTDDVEAYVNKLETIKEHHFGKTTPGKTKLITEEIEYTEEQVEAEAREEKKAANPNMQRYLASLNSTRKA